MWLVSRLLRPDIADITELAAYIDETTRALKLVAKGRFDEAMENSDSSVGMIWSYYLAITHSTIVWYTGTATSTVVNLS